jgi:hypothetical protein
MQNMEQYRAAGALQFWSGEAVKRALGREDAGIVNQLPVLLAANGLLAVVALAKNTGGLAELLVVDIGRFLASPDLKVLPTPVPNLDQLISVLTNERSTALLLQRATAEALAYAGYLRRFAPRRAD